MSPSVYDHPALGLTLPVAALPGFDPLGLMLWWQCPGEGSDWKYLCANSATLDGGTVPILVSGPEVRWPRRSEVRLDFGDAMTRDKVARWCAARVGVVVDSTAPTLRRPPGPWAIDNGRPHADWSLVPSTDVHLFVRKEPTPGPGITYVPALADLDATDMTLLGDGSRFIDALALKLTAQHLGATGGQR